MISSLLSLLPKTRATNITSYKNVCFKGGGVKGLAFVGVDKALSELGMWKDITGFIGSSAGAIFAAAAACRIPYDKMGEVVNTTDFSKFQDAEWGLLSKGYNLMENMGLHKGDYFHEWCGKFLDKFTGDSNITFQDVYIKFGSELVITTTDLTKGKLIYLNRNDNPTMPIRHAIRCSMSIPVFFIPIQVRESDGLIHTYIDGGCTNNFPMNYFNNGPTLGFYLSESDGDCPTKYHDETFKINSVLDIVTTLINTDIEEIQRLRLKESDLQNIINIPTFGIESTNFCISTADIKRLHDSGYASTFEFFKK